MKLNFSFFAYFSSFFNRFRRKKGDHHAKRDFYDLSNKYLTEYIDLKKIIARLQDIDKMKNILFDEQQRYFFDLIPKPEIIPNTSHAQRKKNSFSVEKVIRLKVKKITNAGFFNKMEIMKNNPSPINERILSYLDDRLKEKLRNKTESGNDKKTIENKSDIIYSDYTLTDMDIIKSHKTEN